MVITSGTSSRVGNSQAEMAFDQQDPIFDITPTEQMQIALYRQYWAYAVPPLDGTDVYHAILPGLGQALYSIKKLRYSTRGIMNFAPAVVAKHREGIVNDASETGITSYGKDGRAEDPKQTLFLRDIFKRRWKKTLSSIVMSGLITGKSPVMVDRDSSGKFSLTPLYPNHTFVKRDPNNPKQVIRVDIKYNYLDDDGKDHSYIKRITATEIITEIDKEQKRVPNPFKLIPIIEIKNIDIPGRVDGMNCFSMHLSDIDELCQMIGGWELALSLYGNPKIIAAGTSITKELKMDAPQIFEIPVDGHVTLLEYEKLADQLDKIVKLYEVVKDKVTAFDIQKVMGRAQVSGYAFQLILSAFVAEVMDEKQNYAEGYSELGKMILAIQFGGTPDDYHVETDFGGVLPADLMEEIDREQKLKALEVWDPEQSMKRMGWDDEEIQKVMQGKKVELGLFKAFEENKARAERKVSKKKGEDEVTTDEKQKERKNAHAEF